MTVSLSWLSDISVVINTSVIQVPTFRNAMIMGVFPIASLPVSWNGLLAKAYSSNTDIVADFQPLYDAAVTATNFIQAYKYAILMRAAVKFFAQTPTPNILYLGCLDNTSTINYITGIQAIVNSSNNWYAFYLADQVTVTQLTQATGIYAALDSLKSSNNLKVCFVDTNNMLTTTGNFLFDATQAGVGNGRAALFALPTNPVSTTVVSALPVVDTLGAAVMGAYFTNLFTTGVGLKSMALMQLQATTIDTAITKASLGDVAEGTGLIGVNGNVYPGFGSAPIGLVQYGLMASSTSSSITYLDQVVGADFIQLTVQADLATMLINSQPTGGIGYSEAGVMTVINAFKASLQKAVTQGIIQQFSNNDIQFLTAAQVRAQYPAKVAAGVYDDFGATLTFLGRILRVRASITLGL